MRHDNKNDTYRYMFEAPRLGHRVFIHSTASVTGAVRLGDDVSIWPMTVIRGDVNRITLGPRTTTCG